MIVYTYPSTFRAMWAKTSLIRAGVPKERVVIIRNEDSGLGVDLHVPEQHRDTAREVLGEPFHDGGTGGTDDN